MLQVMLVAVSRLCASEQLGTCFISSSAALPNICPTPDIETNAAADADHSNQASAEDELGSRFTPS